MSEDAPNKLRAALKLDEKATDFMERVFVNGTRHTGFDGVKLFQSLSETGSFKQGFGLSDTAIEGLYTIAHQLLSSGQAGKAEQVFRVLTSVAGDNAEYWLGFGMCASLRGANDLALLAFDTATKLDPVSPAPYFQRLEVFIRLQEWDRAKADLSRFDNLANTDEHAELIQQIDVIRAALNERAPR